MADKLLRSVFSFSSMTLISRFAGLARDVVFARYFGAGMAMDAFFVAFKLPNFLRRLFAEGAFSQAFVPVLAEYKERRDQQAVRELIAYVIGTLGTLLLLLTAVGMVSLPLIFEQMGLRWFTGIEREKYLLAADLILWTFPYIFFISIAALVAGVLNTYRLFALPAFTPVLLNLVLIIAAIGLSQQFEQPVTVIAIGVWVAGLVQLLFLLPALKRLGLLAVPLWGWSVAGVRKITSLMLPAIFGASVVQINLLIDTLIAFLLVSGSVSWLYYSDRLVEFPLGVFGIALSTVLLPRLSRCHAASSAGEFSNLMDWGLRWAVLIALPSAIGLFILAGPMLTTLFAYDAFTVNDVYMSRLSLMAYALGLPAFIAVKILATGFFARQDTKTPVKAAIAAMLTNLFFNLLFVGGLLLTAFEGVHMGLALATGIGAYVNAGLMYYWLRRDAVYQPRDQWSKFALQVVLASAVMAIVLAVLAGDVIRWYERDFVSRLGWLAFWVASGAMIYASVLWLTGVRPASMAVPKLYRGATRENENE